MSKIFLYRIALTISIFTSLSSIILYNVFATSNSVTNYTCASWIPDNTTIYQNKVFDCGTKIWVNFKALDWASLEVKWDLKLDLNTKIEWDLLVHWNLTIKWSLNVLWNLIVTWNITWDNASLVVKWYVNSKNIDIGKNIGTQAVVSTWYVSVWDDSIIAKWIITNWYLKTWNNFYLNWVSKIRWDFTTWSDFEWAGTIYVYWDFTWIKNYSFDWEKLKVTNDFRISTGWSNKWKIYIYWKKVKSTPYSEKNTSLDYLIWEIDPLLATTISSQEFSIIKNRTIRSDKAVYYYKIDASNLNNEIKRLKNSNTNWKNDSLISKKTSELNKIKDKAINEYVDLFKYLDEYIENNEFDVDKYNFIKENRIEWIETYMNDLYWNSVSATIKQITTKTESNKVIIKKWVKVDEDEIIDDTDDDSDEEEITETQEEKSIKERNQLLELREELITKLSPSMISKLDKVLSDLEDSDATYRYPKLIDRIDNMLSKNEYKTKIEIDILKWIKAYLQRDLDERDLIEKVFLTY